jgi:Kef-type K+ transport system membrane component KefB
MRTEYLYLTLVIALFLVPRLLQRFRIPTAITSVALGAFLGIRFHLFAGDTTIPMLGIVSLFLFAGLEVSFSELRWGAKVVTSHLVIQVGLLTLGTALVMQLFRLDVRPAALFSLAVFTPSCGFILDSLGAFGLTEDQRSWVKTKAIASELVALVAMFFIIQSGDVRALGLSTFAIVVLIVVLPLLFLCFAKMILPFAPKSEFTFLIILAFASAVLTRHLGVYYLVGAFVVGVTAVRLRKRLPLWRAHASQGLLSYSPAFSWLFTSSRRGFIWNRATSVRTPSSSAVGSSRWPSPCGSPSSRSTDE